jgi:hypothetical protein
MLKSDIVKLVDEAIEDNEAVIKNAERPVPSGRSGFPIKASSAQQLIWKTDRERRVLIFIKEILTRLPKEVPLTGDAERGLKLLCERRYRRPR